MSSSEKRFQQLLSATSNRTRREIIILLAQAGPKSYSSLIAKLKLRTGTLNHHLQKLGPLLEQDENKLYKLSREGLRAYHFLRRTEDLLALQELPPLARHEIPGQVTEYVLGFCKLVVKTAQAFKEAGAHRFSYSLVALTILLVLYATSLRSSSGSLLSLSILLVSWTLFSSAFQRLVYRSRTSIANVSLTVGLASLPYIPIILVGTLPISENGSILLPSTLPFENPWQIGLTQLYALLFLWRFALLFLGMRELCALSSSRALTVVFVASLVESIISFMLAGFETVLLATTL